jgi:hypothetical protein
MNLRNRPALLSLYSIDEGLVRGKTANLARRQDLYKDRKPFIRSHLYVLGHRGTGFALNISDTAIV